MAVDRNAVIKLHKSGNSNVEIAKRMDMNHSTVWKIVKKFQETGNTDQRPEENGVSAPLNSPKHEEKVATKRLPKCRTLATAAGVSKSTMHQIFRDDRLVKPFKMLHRQELTEKNQVAMRAQKCMEIL